MLSKLIVSKIGFPRFSHVFITLFSRESDFRVQYVQQEVDHLQLGQTQTCFEIQTSALALLYKLALLSQRYSEVPWDGSLAVSDWKIGN
jgi:hypothetical protein